MIYGIIAFLLALQSETFYLWCQIRRERAPLFILGGRKRNPATRSVLYSPLKRSVFGSHGIQTLKVVTSHPLSRTHLTSSEAKVDGWGWNEVCQTRQQSSHSKRIPLIKLILAIYYWLLLSSSVGSFASDTAAIDNGSRCKINDWAGKCLGIWLAKTLKCFWVHLISNAALCPLRGFIPTAASGLLYQFVEEGCCPDNRRIIFK